VKRHWRYGLWVLSLVMLSGCGDTPKTLVRTTGNMKNELMDRLMKVTDEASAKKFDALIVKVRDDVKKLDDKYAEVIKTIIDDDEVVKPKSLDKQIKEIKRQEGFDKSDDLQAKAKVIQDRLDAYYDELLGDLKKLIKADKERFDHEKIRLDAIIKQLKDEQTPCVILEKLADRKTYEGTLLTIPIAPGLKRELPAGK
jgi:hypothetical protein